MRTRKHLMAALALLAASTLAACGTDASGEEAAPPAAQPVPIRTAPVAEEEVAEPIAATGTLAAEQEAALGFKVGGVIARILVDEGQPVARGQTLALLDPAEIDAQVTRARVAAEKAERDLARARSLYADSVATLEQLQDATSASQAARAELRIAAFNRQYARIAAPAAGTVLRRMAEEGEMVSPGTPVLSVGTGAGGGATVLRAGLADRDAVRLERGDAAEVRFDAFPGETFRGRVTETAAAASAGTGTYEVEVTIDPAGRRLVSGLVGRVEIVPSRTRRMHLVPVEALLEADGDRGVVFAPGADGKARRLPVRIAFLRGERVAIAGGLDGVAEVVTDGAAYLDEGTPVRRAER